MAEEEGIEPSVPFQVTSAFKAGDFSPTSSILPYKLAEKVGFEPTAPGEGCSRFRDESIRPLSHFSINFGRGSGI